MVKGLSHSDAFFAVINTAAVDIESKQSQIAIHSNIYHNLKFAYDLACWQTAFLKKADDFGAKTKNGFDMLFYQSVASLEIWLGKDIGLDVSMIAELHDGILSRIS